MRVSAAILRQMLPRTARLIVREGEESREARATFEPRFVGGITPTPLPGEITSGLDRDLSNVPTFADRARGCDDVTLRSDAAAVAYLRGHRAIAATIDRSTILVRPEFAAAREVLAHEHAHVAQLRSGRVASRGDAERAAELVAGGSAQDPGGAAAPPMFQTATMTREEFEKTVKRRFSVIDVRTGTLAEQQAATVRYGVPPNPGLTASMWQAWNPGPNSEVYRDIIDGILALGKSFGGIPPLAHIVFYDSAYELDASGVAVKQPRTGASYSAGTLTIYRWGSGGDLLARPPLPFARSVAGGNYPGAPVATISGTGTAPGAPLGLPTQREGVMRVTEHELGHGLAEAALTPRGGGTAADPEMIRDYAKEVGWYPATGSQKLYDAGSPAVQTAFTKKTTPPAESEITVEHWNDPKWIEQPISGYSVSGGPSEDFAEAVMAYIDNPSLLRSRSPRRFTFLEKRKSLWQPQLTPPKP